jgi:hypothetical protein
MKPLPLFLAVSVAANIALAAIIWARIAPALPSAGSGIGTAASESAKPNAGKKLSTELRAALASGDPVALAAAGIPAETIRTLTIGHAFDILQSRITEIQSKQDHTRYWRNESSREIAASRARQREINQARRDFEDEIRNLYGVSAEILFSHDTTTRHTLPPAILDRLSRLEQDYFEMDQQIQRDLSRGGAPSDYDRLTQLYDERKRDLAKEFTPAERELIDLHDSYTALTVRDRFGDFLETEAEYKKMFSIVKAFDDRLADPNQPRTPEDRRRAGQTLLTDIRTALGPERWDAVERANDPDNSTLQYLQDRFNVPGEATATVLAARSRYAALSQEIYANKVSSDEEKKSRLQALATQLTSELSGVLGPEAGQVFARQTGWISILQTGHAYSVGPADTSSGIIEIGPRARVFPPLNAEALPK